MYRNCMKRFVDIVFSIFAFPALLLVLVIVGPIIYLHDKGPIFYKAPRLGRGGRVFIMYKFRSMKVNAPDIRNQDGSTFNSPDDPRLTTVGKFLRKTSLDELPQLINVLKGDMSLIGPRPDLPEALHMYSDVDRRKLEVRPGITGYNQAFFRNSIPPKEKFRNDVYYVSNLSCLLDLKIVAITLIRVFGKKGVFTNEGLSAKQEVLHNDNR